MIRVDGQKHALLAVAMIAVSVLGGCIPQEARNDASYLAALTQKVQADGEHFAAFREELDRARQENADVLEQSTLEAEQTTQHLLSVWAISKAKEPQDAFDAVHVALDKYAQGLTVTQQLQERQQKDMDALHTGVQIRSDQLSETSKALARLAEPPDFKTQAFFLISFAQDVNKDLKAAQDKAKADSDTGKEKAKSAQAKAKEVSKAEKPKRDKLNEAAKKLVAPAPDGAAGAPK